MTQLGVYLLYFGIAGFSYYFLCPSPRSLRSSDTRSRPPHDAAPALPQGPGPERNLDERIRLPCVLRRLEPADVAAWLNLMTLPWFVAECRGYSAMYASMADGPFGDSWAGYAYAAVSAVLFLVWTDFAIYWVHRWLHWPSVYKHLHKPHHKWVIPTPFASHAFHPIDGYLQSLPYHMCVGAAVDDADDAATSS